MKDADFFTIKKRKSYLNYLTFVVVFLFLGAFVLESYEVLEFGFDQSVTGNAILKFPVRMFSKPDCYNLKPLYDGDELGSVYYYGYDGLTKEQMPNLLTDVYYKDNYGDVQQNKIGYQELSFSHGGIHSGQFSAEEGMIKWYLSPIIIYELNFNYDLVFFNGTNSAKATEDFAGTNIKFLGEGYTFTEAQVGTDPPSYTYNILQNLSFKKNANTYKIVRDNYLLINGYSAIPGTEFYAKGDPGTPSGFIHNLNYWDGFHYYTYSISGSYNLSVGQSFTDPLFNAYKLKFNSIDTDTQGQKFANLTICSTKSFSTKLSKLDK